MTGHRHDAVCHDSAEQLLAVAVPFLRGGVAAGEPTLVSASECTAGLVRAALPPGGAGVRFLTDGAVYTRPAAALRAYQEMFAGYVAGGAPRIRVLGELPRSTFGATWDWWARYESAVNHVWDRFPIWSLCVYDVRATPPAVLADVGRTHRHSFRPGGRYAANPGYTEPAVFLTEPRGFPPDPLLRSVPVLTLADPSPKSARSALRAAHRGALSGRALDGLLLAVTEAVTNAQQHGKGPVEVRAWRGPGRMVVTVTDAGRGPEDPFAGLVPDSGHGLWLSHLFADHVVMARGPGGFTIRITAGTDPGPR